MNHMARRRRSPSESIDDGREAHRKLNVVLLCDKDTTTSDLSHKIGVQLENARTTLCNGVGMPRYPTAENQDKLVWELCQRADLLVLAPLNADSIAKMLHGMVGTFELDVLRSWDVSKKIILVPYMTKLMWENPMTKKHLHKIRRKWTWIRVLPPMLYTVDEDGNWGLKWDAMDELLETVRNQAELMVIGQDADTAMGISTATQSAMRKSSVKVPPEIWSNIFEFVGDWEVSVALGVYTRLPVPKEWQKSQELANDMSNLEWTILTGNLENVATWLETKPTPKFLSILCVKIIIKFARTDILSYLEEKYKDLFWATFGHKLLPTKASAVFGRVEVLEWWQTSPSFLAKEYNPEAVDGASRAGFVHVLDWWRKSGLSVSYSEAALEQASSKGRIEVLEWWKAASMHQGAYHIDHDDSKRNDKLKPSNRIKRKLEGNYQWGMDTPPEEIKAYTPSTKKGTSTRHQVWYSGDPYDNTQRDSESSSGDEKLGADMPNSNSPLLLKVGKSICCAAQNGQASTVRWWDTSGIPYLHEETVARIASAHGHVNVLELWKELKGGKMMFDNQVLVGPTKNGHRDVLEWWRESGYRVEYKTCDIEEALEDALEGKSRDLVKAWWARNGLNLGVGTSEWMQVKTLRGPE